MTNLLTRHEAKYIAKKGTEMNRLTSGAYVPKDFSIDETDYTIACFENILQVISSRANKSECLVGPEGWIVEYKPVT